MVQSTASLQLEHCRTVDKNAKNAESNASFEMEALDNTIALLEAENTALKLENGYLQQKIAGLEARLSMARPAAPSRSRIFRRPY